ncbi:MAG: M14 family metallocarboxypeptidase [Verrucomicrobiota bacterium]
MSSSPSKFQIKRFVERLRETMPRLRFQEQTLGHVGEHPILVYTRKAFDPDSKETIEPKARIFISAGVHGDEPAPPLAIIRMASENRFRADVEWTIFPALNPSGLEVGTRENAEGVDLNRDYKTRQTYEVRCQTRYIESLPVDQPNWDLAICLHEDYDTAGFYLYQVDDTEIASTICRHVIVRTSEFMEIEPGSEIDGMPAENGIINPLEVYPDIHQSRPDLPEAAYLFKNFATRTYTLETPSSAYIETRISTQVAAALGAIETVCSENT